MTINTWATTLSNSFQDLWAGIIQFLPNLIVALAIFLLGWIIGAVLGRAIAEILRRLNVDRALREAGVDDVVGRAGFRLDIGGFLGGIVKWFVIIVFLIASLDVLGLNEVNDFLRDVVLVFLPDVVVAILILLAGVLIGEVAKRTVTASAASAGMRSANFLGTVAKWAIWIFATLAALAQLGIAAVFLQTLFTGVVIALSLAFGLAFGLGGRDEAANVLRHMREEIKHPELPGERNTLL
jgi:hypothetical protein